MHVFLLAIHNVLRWVVLVLAIVAAVFAFLGWFKKRAWEERDRKFGLFLTIAIDIQLLLGLLLYFTSQLVKTALQDFGAAMAIADARQFALEHPFYMILALVFAHLGSTLPKKVDDPQAKFKRAAIFFALTVLFLLLGIPWMRPLFPRL